MRRLIYLSATLSLILICVSCRKDKHDPEQECLQLKTGLTTNDASLVKGVITTMIYRLPSRKYTAANLQQLAATLREQCDVTDIQTCYGCEYGLHSKSAILVTVAGSTPLRKVIGIADNTRGELSFLNVHD